MTMPNIELARKTLAHIEELERRAAAGEKLCEHWDQSDWGCYVGEDYRGGPVSEKGNICGTAMCFAGWACKLAGEPLVLIPSTYNPSYARYAVIVADGRQETIATRAGELLDLPPHIEAGRQYGRDERLFDAYNDLDKLRELVQGLEDGTYLSIEPGGADDD